MNSVVPRGYRHLIILLISKVTLHGFDRGNLRMSGKEGHANFPGEISS